MPEQVTTEAAPAAQPTTTEAPAAPAAPAAALTPHEAALKILQDAEGQPAEPAEAKTDPPAETKTEERSPEPKPDPMAQKFEALARETAKVRQEKEGLKQQMLAFQQQMEARFGKYLQAEEAMKAGGKSAALEALGITMGDLIEERVKGAPTPPRPAQPQKVELPPEIVQQLQELQAWRAKAELQEYRAKVMAEAAKSPDTYEMVLAEGDEGIQLALDAALEIYRETGEWPEGSPDAAIPLALKKAQEVLDREAEKKFERLLKTKKFQAKLSSVVTTSASPGPHVRDGQKPKTLTNGQTGAPPPRPTADPLDVEALKAQVAEMLAAED